MEAEPGGQWCCLVYVRCYDTQIMVLYKKSTIDDLLTGKNPLALYRVY